jgi:hypothetical protein
MNINPNLILRPIPTLYGTSSSSDSSDSDQYILESTNEIRSFQFKMGLTGLKTVGGSLQQYLDEFSHSMSPKLKHSLVGFIELPSLKPIYSTVTYHKEKQKEWIDPSLIPTIDVYTPHKPNYTLS